jgi:hypothetical protein
MVLRRVQQPITKFIGPWEDFMVHGVNNPLINNYPKFGATVTLDDQESACFYLHNVTVFELDSQLGSEVD